MITFQIFVENIKCGGCINSIKTALLKLNGVVSVEVDKTAEQISVTGIAIERNELVMKLAALGYPEKGNNNLISKAKSFVSCAVGRYDRIK